MAVRIHSTLSGTTEDLAPLSADGVLRMYVCGMTPKFHPHIGHGRVFVAMDVIRRYLEYRGFRLKHVQNFTDIDDKIIERAEREQRDPEAAAREYIDSYFGVMDRLRVLRAHEFPRVTTCMDQIIRFVNGLVETGHAYPVDGDVYFEVSTFPEYGKLSRRDLNSQLVAARKELEPGKRDPRDFALWKRAKPAEPAWDSPWGPGRPGWHIECSAMARETLGDQLDIHGGGADLIFPHHENEIAQSESLTHVPFVRHWAHTGLVVTPGGDKMAHSMENFVTLADILEAYDPAEVRYYLTATHYRSPLPLIYDSPDGRRVRGIDEARAALGRLRRAVGFDELAPGRLWNTAVGEFEAAMDADFNTPDALAVIFDVAREVNRRRDAGESATDVDDGRRTIVHLLAILGLWLPRASGTQDIGPYVELALDIRRKLREARQWELADFVRNGLLERGIVVEDKPGGESAWRPKD